MDDKPGCEERKKEGEWRPVKRRPIRERILLKLQMKRSPIVKEIKEH